MASTAYREKRRVTLEEARAWKPIGPAHSSLVSPLLNLKLAQMMVEMLIHQCGPFDRSERPEKEVRMLRADRGAAGHKAVDRFAQVLLFDGEIAFIDHEAALLGRRIAAHRLAFH